MPARSAVFAAASRASRASGSDKNVDRIGTERPALDGILVAKSFLASAVAQAADSACLDKPNQESALVLGYVYKNGKVKLRIGPRGKDADGKFYLDVRSSTTVNGRWKRAAGLVDFFQAIDKALCPGAEVMIRCSSRRSDGDGPYEWSCIVSEF